MKKTVRSVAIVTMMLVVMLTIPLKALAQETPPYIPEGLIGISPNTIFNGDAGTQITNGSVYPATAIAQLAIKYPNNTTLRYGTGFMYCSTAMATAAHSINDGRFAGWATSMTAYFGRTTSGSYLTQTINMSNCYVPNGWTGNFESGQAVIDYGVIKFPSTVGTTTGWFGIDQNASVNLDVIVQGYRTEGNTVYYNQWRSTGKLMIVDNDWALFRNGTLPGNSGSPVFTSDYYARAINTYSSTNDNYISNPTDQYNWGKRISGNCYNFLMQYYQ